MNAPFSCAPRIVVLDGATLNPGDLSWEELTRLGACTVYDRTSPAQTVERAAGAEIVLTNKVPLGAAEIARLPSLRYIGVLATGYNVVDTEAARRAGVIVTNVPDYSTPSVAQLTFALLLELTHGVGAHSEGVRSGRWSRAPDFCYWEQPLVELTGRRFGIIGFGRIGRRVARMARAMEMRVVTFTPRPASVPRGVRWMELDSVFECSDVVSLHCPLTPATERLVNAERLRRMKSSAYLLNTARGGLIDEAALAEALRTGRLAGAGLDVLSQEPPPPDHPLLHAPRCVLTPHLAWATQAARERLMRGVVGNVRAFLEGHPQNVVNA